MPHSLHAVGQGPRERELIIISEAVAHKGAGWIWLIGLGGAAFRESFRWGDGMVTHQSFLPGIASSSSSSSNGTQNCIFHALHIILNCLPHLNCLPVRVATAQQKHFVPSVSVRTTTTTKLNSFIRDVICLLDNLCDAR